MRVATAQLPGPDETADRVFVLENAVIVLDGASAFEPVDLAPGDYAQALGESIAVQLTDAPNAELPAVVADAIADVVAKHDLQPGASPSSTVSILRARSENVDLYVLGDSPIHYGNDAEQHVLTDNRLAELQLAERDGYRSRLRAGHGYDYEHRRLLGELQRKQRHLRNREPGFWIAEAIPGAAHQALITTLPRAAITWAVLATDGAADVLNYLGCNQWHEIAGRSAEHLSALLHYTHRWEGFTDPVGQQLPRAKRHDDKTISAVLVR